MKKLMLAVAIVCAAAMAQAAQVKWVGSIGALNAAGVGDNGNYAATGSFYNKGTLTYTILFYSDSARTDLVATESGSQSITATGKGNTSLNPSALETQKTYYYTLVLSGTQNDLNARGKEEKFDYTDAAISQTLQGQVTTKKTGTAQISDTSVTSWNVSGIQSVPEPTSGLLLLLGVAGLALRRKQK